MRQTLFVASFLTFLFTSFSSVESKTQSSSNWLNQAIGDYQSQIFNKTTVMPGRTIFSRDKTGTLVGRYSIDEGKEVISGKLTQCLPTRTLALRCVWADRYGTGTLQVTFSKDFSKFSGSWSEKDSRLRHLWNGSRL